MTQRFLDDPPMPDVAAQWRHYFSVLGCEPGHRVLDVGCDRGDADHLLLELAPGIGGVVGLDRSTKRIAEAFALLRRRGAPARVTFVTGDGAHLPFRDASFQRVFSADTLEWISSPLRAIAELKRVLAPGGQALLVHTDFEMQAFEGGDPVLTREITHRFTHSGPDGRIGRRLGVLAREAGFQNIETQVYTLVNERYEPGCYAHRLSELMVSWLRQKKLMPARTLQGWRESLAAAAAEGRFW